MNDKEIDKIKQKILKLEEINKLPKGIRTKSRRAYLMFQNVKGLGESDKKENDK